MTLSTTSSRMTYTGNGSTTAFPFTFKIFASSDLVVTQRDADTDVETTLTLTTHYSVSGVGESAGGTVTLVTAPPTGDTLTIRRVRTLTQTSAFPTGGAYSGSSMEAALDKLVMVDQQQQDELDRSIKLPTTFDPADYELNLPVPEVGQVVTWAANGPTFSTLDDSDNVALPGDSRTVATLTAYLENNKRFNVWDYATSGVVGYAEINAALTAASAEEAVAYVPPGTYTIASPILIPSNSGIWLEAGATLVRAITGGGAANATIRNSDQVNGNTNIRILGDGTIKTVTDTFTGKHIGLREVTTFAIRDINITGIFGDWNIFCSDCTNGRISGLYIDSGTVVFEDGLHFEGGSDIVVTNCWIKCGDDAIAIVQEQNFAETDMDGFVIDNCYLESTGANAIRIDIFDDMTPSNRGITNVTISNVKCKSVGNGLIIRDQSNTGLLTHVKLSKVLFDGSALTGVIIIDGVVGMEWDDVKFVDPASRIQLDNSTDVLLREVSHLDPRNAAQQNLLVSTGGACTNVRILGGHYRGATQHGIAASGSNVTTDMQIIGALIEDATNSGIALGAAAAGTVIKGVRSKGNGAYGISVEASASTTTLEGNDVRGNTSGGILDAGTNTYQNRNRRSTGPLSGRAVLVGGTVTVSTAEVAASDNIHLTRVVTGGTVGHLSVGTIVAATSFVINSSSATDTSTIFWEIVH